MAIRRRPVIETTAGRVCFNEIWPEGLGFINTTVGKKQISDIIWRCFQTVGQKETVNALDRLKQLGFREATAPVAPSVSPTWSFRRPRPPVLRTPTSRSTKSRSSIAWYHHAR
jgi:hypothetical protein